MHNLDDKKNLNLQENGNLLNNLDKLNKMPSNFCVNGKDPTIMTNKQYLREFSKGPCSPNVILPGLLSTKLLVTIDCQELKSFDPTTFNLCGWNSCSKRIFEVSYIHLQFN